MDEDITFEKFLSDKLIDSEKFKQSESNKYTELEQMFGKMHPDSFTAQKLFLINPIRRKYTLEVDEKKEEAAEKPKIKLRPKIKR